MVVMVTSKKNLEQRLLEQVPAKASEIDYPDQSSSESALPFVQLWPSKMDEEGPGLPRQ